MMIVELNLAMVSYGKFIVGGELIMRDNSLIANVVLIGFMGTGKSTVGASLAARLDYSFIDLDEEIVQRDGRSIPDIFAQDGEAYFRDAESRALADLMNKERVIIATGGGCVLREANCKVMQQHGFVVHLTAELDTIVDRVKGDHNRPLLQGDASERVRSLMTARQGKYDFAHAVIPTDGLQVEEISDAVIKAFTSFQAAGQVL